jgi:hypothetical protein
MVFPKRRRKLNLQSFRKSTKIAGIVGAVLCTMALWAFLQAPMVDADEAKMKMQQEAFQLFQAKCMGCHDSVADPEKPGRTRDDWHLVVNVMHGYGLDMTDAESVMIVDLLYDLRQGIEKEAG